MNSDTAIKLTAEQEALIAKAIKENKPYFIELEGVIASLGFGTIDVQFEIRAGAVEKMSFYNKKTWIRDKAR